VKKPSYQWLLSQQLIRELGSLRGGQGLTREAFDKAVTLQYVLAVGDSTLTRRQLQDRFIEKLRELNTTPQVRALRNAYGVDLESNPGTLTKRREDFAQQENVDTTDTVKNWENTAIEEMVLELTGALHNGGTMRILSRVTRPGDVVGGCWWAYQSRR
jgi:hypothetical protein